MRALVRQRIEKPVPTPMPGAQSGRGHQYAKYCLIRFHKLQAGITAGEQNEIDMISQRFLLARRERIIHLQSDQAGTARGSRDAAQIMFAGGKEHRSGGQSPERTTIDSERSVLTIDRPDSVTPENRGSTAL